ncbi:MAG: hypothetical protein JNM24_17105 [Bdellovibrionaceae bacterium]|nr:hypothetical protein [Pseudobdellovibrionaceae bacterium]
MKLNLVRFLMTFSLLMSACTLKVQVSSTLPPVDKLSPSSPKIDLSIASFKTLIMGLHQHLKLNGRILMTKVARV